MRVCVFYQALKKVIRRVLGLSIYMFGQMFKRWWSTKERGVKIKMVQEKARDTKNETDGDLRGCC